MKRPPITLENYNHVYDWYEQHEQGQISAWLGHTILAGAIRPDIATTSPETAERIGECLNEGRQLILTPNHVSDIDPPVLASLTRHFEPFREVEGNAFILSKATLFKNALLRRTIDGLGAVPLFRTGDIDRSGKRLPVHIRELRNRARDHSFQTARNKLEEQGQHMGIYPEGKRFPDDPYNVHDFGFGLEKILCNLDADIAVVPIGVVYPNAESNGAQSGAAYAEQETRGKLGRTVAMIRRMNAQRHPFVTIGDPVIGPFATQADIYPPVQAGMQAALDMSAHREQLARAA